MNIQFLLDQYPLLAASYEIACEAHKDDFRKDNVTPYMSHVDNVIYNTYKLLTSEEPFQTKNYSYYIDDIALSVAALHDVYEDHPIEYSLEKLIAMLILKVSDRKYSIYVTINAVDAISKKPRGEETYTKYLKRVLSCKFSLVVKIADLQHNMSDLKPGNLLDKYDLTMTYLKNS